MKMSRMDFLKLLGLGPGLVKGAAKLAKEEPSSLHQEALSAVVQNRTPLAGYVTTGMGDYLPISYAVPQNPMREYRHNMLQLMEKRSRKQQTFVITGIHSRGVQ
jgi:hypothetical protein